MEVEYVGILVVTGSGPHKRLDFGTKKMSDFVTRDSVEGSRQTYPVTIVYVRSDLTRHVSTRRLLRGDLPIRGDEPVAGANTILVMNLHIEYRGFYIRALRREDNVSWRGSKETQHRLLLDLL